LDDEIIRIPHHLEAMVNHLVIQWIGIQVRQ
jgi:hypothetical protein